MAHTRFLTGLSAAAALLAGGAFLTLGEPATAAQSSAASQSSQSNDTAANSAKKQASTLDADSAKIDGEIFHAQVLLDRRGFSPGVIDGRDGKSFTKAIEGFQESRGLDINGTLDTPTRKALLKDKRRPVRKLRVDKASFGSPFVNPMPDNPEKQAELEAMNYRNLLEEIAERFHTTPAVIVELNDPKMVLKEGSVLNLPNVLPSSRDFTDLEDNHAGMMSAFNIQPSPASGERVVVDESEGVLKVYDGDDKLVAQFPVTMGSENDPLPLGDWKATTYAFLPPFNYQPELFWDVEGDGEIMLPPGPNGPVGVAWLDLTKEHYGIHGTPEPQTIGYTQSHGCIRMTNWDVLTLTRMVKPGFAAKFQS